MILPVAHWLAAAATRLGASQIPQALQQRGRQGGGRRRRLLAQHGRQQLRHRGRGCAAGARRLRRGATHTPCWERVQVEAMAARRGWRAGLRLP